MVTLTDVKGIRHKVEVDRLFEAGVMALATLKADDWIDGIGPMTRLDVEVAAPVVCHTITVQQL